MCDFVDYMRVLSSLIPQNGLLPYLYNRLEVLE